MNILEELYYGNINISERDVKEGSDEQAALSAASDAQIKLMDPKKGNTTRSLVVICVWCFILFDFHNAPRLPRVALYFSLGKFSTQH